MSNKKRQITFSLSDEDIMKLKNEANRGGESISSLVRRIIILYMKDELITRKVLRDAIKVEKLRSADTKDVY